MVGEKVAIVSDKPQTTRNRIRGVWTGTLAPAVSGGPPLGGQVVFVDTPGVHVARGELNRFMVREAFSAIEGVDAALLVVEAFDGPGAARGRPAGAVRLPEGEQRLLERLVEAKLPTVLAINKVDRVKDKSALLPQLEAWAERAGFAAMVPISATRGVGVVELVRELLAVLPVGPPLFDADTLTDRSERFLAAELVREQLFIRLRQELPYSTAVEVDNWEERSGQGDVVIDATIYVERESQKAIVVGKGGTMIRDVGASAREEISRVLGRAAHLRLHVKVETDWTASAESLARMGYKEEE